jgi:hypothetical protein
MTNESLLCIRRLLEETQILARSGTKKDQRAAINKLQSIAALAATLALTLDCRRR